MSTPEEEVIIIRRGAVIRILQTIYREHLTKILGYAGMVISAVPLIDRQLMIATIGENGLAWVMLFYGLSIALRGHTNKVKTS